MALYPSTVAGLEDEKGVIHPMATTHCVCALLCIGSVLWEAL